GLLPGIGAGRRTEHCDDSRLCERSHLFVTSAEQQVGRCAPDLGGKARGTGLTIGAGMQSRLKADRSARSQDPAGLARAEPAVVAVRVNAVRSGRGRVRAPAADRVYVV